MAVSYEACGTDEKRRTAEQSDHTKQELRTRPWIEGPPSTERGAWEHKSTFMEGRYGED
jgi:hypothetical protein